jgi:hypothetical protein
VKQSLAELAAPFAERAKNYEALYSTELSKVQNLSDVEYGKHIAAASGPTFEYTPSRKGVASNATIKTESVREALATLSRAPDDTGTLSQLESIYSSAGKTRIASYYRGRLIALQKDLQKEGNKP